MMHHRSRIGDAADGMPIAALGLDEFEQGLLPVLRHFLTALAQPEGGAWRLAFGIAAERWGPGDGPQIAHRLLGMIEALQAVRLTVFEFGNPLCLHCRDLLTADEVALLTLLHHMRRDRTDAARLALSQVTGGVMDAGLIRAGLAFAARFPAEAVARGRPETLRLH